MRKLSTKNPKNTHCVEIADNLFDTVVKKLGEAETYHCIRNYSPNGNSLPSSTHVGAMFDNRARGVHRDNPGAWRIRDLNPTPNSYERGIARHYGKWTKREDNLPTALLAWENEQGEAPSYENAEFYKTAGVGV